MNLFFYRDSDGLEIDCVIENNDDEWIGIEIKLGSVEGIENGIKNLNKFYNKLTAEKQKHCKSLNIICASKTSFKVDEKINVISLADLYLEQ
jgi:predicted AAA+ superfamily ATPase